MANRIDRGEDADHRDDAVTNQRNGSGSRFTSMLGWLLIIGGIAILLFALSILSGWVIRATFPEEELVFQSPARSPDQGDPHRERHAAGTEANVHSGSTGR